MNKKLLWTFLVIILAATATYAVLHFFKGSSKHLRMIPGKALMVAKIDFKSMFQKLDYDGEFQKTKFYKYFEKETKPSKEDEDNKIFEEIFRNPMSTGINVFSQTYLFSFVEDEINYMGFVADLRDKGNFNRTMEKFPSIKSKIKKTKDFYFYKLSPRTVFAWNENGLLILSEIGRSLADTDKEDVEVIANDLMLQAEGVSVNSIPEFNAFKEQKADLSVFLNYELLLTTYGNTSADSAVHQKVVSDYRGVYMDASLNFLEDSIQIAYKISGDQKKIDELNYIKKTGLSENGLQLPDRFNPLAVLALNVEIQKLLKMVKNYGAPAERVLDNLNPGNRVDWSNTFNGEFVFSLIDIQTKKAEYYDYQMDESSGNYLPVLVSRNQPDPIFCAYIGLKNKSEFFKLFSNQPFEEFKNMKRKLISPYDSTFFYLMEGPTGVYICNNLPISEKMATHVKNPSKKVHAKMQTATRQANYFFLDLELSHYPQVFSEQLQEMYGNSGFKQFKDYTNFLQSIEMRGHNNQAVLNINFKHEKGNVLYRIFKQMDCINMFK